MKVLAIIPARGGSKGVPGKNSYPIAGKPLINYTIDCAQSSRCLAAIYVSSDDEHILHVSKTDGITCLKRPAELAQDQTSIVPVISHVLEIAEMDTNSVFDAIMLLQPTAPLREPEHITGSIEALESSGVNAVISVCEMTDLHPARMYRINNNLLDPFVPEYEKARRQDIPPAYYRNGSIYLVRREAFFQQNQVMAKPSAPFIMDSKYLCNIDEPRDMIVAEALINAWKDGRL